MPSILAIKSSAGGETSASSRLVDHLVARLVRERPDASVVEHDLDRESIPHIRRESLAGIGRPAPETEQARATRELSDRLVAEVHAADFIVIGAPMYNFGVPSTLKSWFDHVLRAGQTFRFGPDGREGLVAPKPTVVIQTRGGFYSEGPTIEEDSQEPHLRTMLDFIGLTDIRFIRLEKMAREAAEQVERAKRDLDGIVWG